MFCLRNKKMLLFGSAPYLERWEMFWEWPPLITHCLIYIMNLITVWEAVLYNTNRKARKRTYWHVRPTKTQISLRIRTVWLESSLSAWRNVASLAIQNAPSEDSGKIARIVWSDQHCVRMSKSTFPDVAVQYNLVWLITCCTVSIVADSSSTDYIR